jgi:hypothetical protein
MHLNLKVAPKPHPQIIWRDNNKYNVIQHKDTQHNGAKRSTEWEHLIKCYFECCNLAFFLTIVVLSVIILSVAKLC